ncbi:hypothetical protein AMS68_008046 [Peltaster fructicola]|uniref:FAD dependent oxidoreductase domain-containing protein n=1 Tax=Peltaster fructicola TaxID=286661 RepID=A0A6H0Y6S2_9PEZI|nr:hypothetical protein AMS68_008046 [Peltaster fructicola]
MDERAQLSVSLPHPSPTISYWQDPPSDLADHRSTVHLPELADYVIVGSGISGVSIAYNLLLQQPEASVVLLEARQTCSGATGRNGGHTKAASYRSFLDHEREYGLDEAIKIARLEHANIKLTHALARDYAIDCASVECDTVDVVYDQKQFDSGKQAIARMIQTMPGDPAAHYRIWDATDTHHYLYTPGAVGSFQYAAGSLSAYAFVIGMLRLALSRGLNLQTRTSVTNLTKTDSDWTVTTPRGDITAAKVIIATNGYTARLLPQMQGLIVPLHGQIVAQRPGLCLPVLPRTYSFIYKTGYEYMITRPPGTVGQGDIIIGGGIHKLPRSGASRYGNTDDSTLEPTITDYLRHCTKRCFSDKWGEDDTAGTKEWSGIMGATADGLPYVGAVPDMQGIYISAGFNGHGMVLCLKLAEALVHMMNGDVPDWLPRSMLITKDRMQVRFTGRKDLRAPGEAQFGSR